MHDATLEEMWRVKRKLGTEHKTWDEYVAALFAFQEEERRQGVKIVTFPPRRINDDPQPLASSVAEGPPPSYQA